MKRPSRVRDAIAAEAAKLMEEEGVGQYFDAKRIAARRVLGSEARGAHFRPNDLPSNGEIREAIRQRSRLREGPQQGERLFAMRLLAWQLMGQLEDFTPRLIGSVWSGHARRGSDIDLHVFVDDPERLDTHLATLGWAFRSEEVLIRVSTGFRTFRHVHVLDHAFDVELSVYGRHELRITTRSSTDGKPIDRVSRARLEARLGNEHADPWQRWQATRELCWEEAPASGPFDGLLRELNDKG